MISIFQGKLKKKKQQLVTRIKSIQVYIYTQNMNSH